MLYLADNNSITLTILLLIHKIFNKKDILISVKKVICSIDRSKKTANLFFDAFFSENCCQN